MEKLLTHSSYNEYAHTTDYESLRLILGHESGREFTLDEATEIGLSLIEFYVALAEPGAEDDS